MLELIGIFFSTITKLLTHFVTSSVFSRIPNASKFLISSWKASCRCIGTFLGGMFHSFLRWKDRVYKQLFYITDCDRSPNLLSMDACYILGLLKPCYTVENSTDSTDSTHASNKDDLAAKSFLHQKMKESERKLSNCSNKQSISKRQLQGGPLKKQDILDIYSDVFTRIGKFPGLPYKFQLKPNGKPTRHALLYFYSFPS